MSIPYKRQNKDLDTIDEGVEVVSKVIIGKTKQLKPKIQQSTADFLRPVLSRQATASKVSITQFEKQNLFSSKNKLSSKGSLAEKQHRVLYGSIEFKEPLDSHKSRKELSPNPPREEKSSQNDKDSEDQQIKSRSFYFENLKTNFKAHSKPSLNALIKKEVEIITEKQKVLFLEESQSSSPTIIKCEENEDFNQIPEIINIPVDKDNTDLEISPRYGTPREKHDSARKLTSLLSYKCNSNSNAQSSKKVQNNNTTENRFFKKKQEPSVQSLSVQKEKGWANNSLSNFGNQRNPYGSVPKLLYYNEASLTSPYSKIPINLEPNAIKLVLDSAIKKSERSSTDRYNLFDVGIKKKGVPISEGNGNAPQNTYFFKPVQKELLGDGGYKIDFCEQSNDEPLTKSVSRSRLTAKDKSLNNGLRKSEYVMAMGTHRNSQSPIGSTFQELKVVVNPIAKLSEDGAIKERPSSPTFNIEVIKNQEKFKPRNSLDFKTKGNWQSPFGQFPSSTTNSIIKTDTIDKTLFIQSIRQNNDLSFKSSVYSQNFQPEKSQEKNFSDLSIKDKIFKNLKKTDTSKILANPYDPSFNTKIEMGSEKSGSYLEKGKQTKYSLKQKNSVHENLSDASSTQQPKSFNNISNIQVINYKIRENKISEIVSPISSRAPTKLELSRKERLIKKVENGNSSLCNFNNEVEAQFINLRILAENNGQDIANLKTYLDTFIGNFERREMLLEDISSLNMRIEKNTNTSKEVQFMLSKIRSNVDLNKQMVSLNNEKCLIINNLNALQNEQMEIHEYMETIDHKAQVIDEERKKQNEAIHKLGLKLQEYVHTSTIYRNNFVANIASKIKYIPQETQSTVMKIIQDIIGYDCASLREQVKNCTSSHAENVFVAFNDKLIQIVETFEDKASPRTNFDFKGDLKIFVKITRQYNDYFIEKYRLIVSSQRKMEELKNQESELNFKRGEFIDSAERNEKEIEAAQLALNKINAEKIQLRFQQNGVSENQYNFNDTMNSTKFDNYDEELLYSEELFEYQIESLSKILLHDQRSFLALSIKAEGFEKIFIENFATIIGLSKDILFNMETENDRISTILESCANDRKADLKRKLESNNEFVEILQSVISHGTEIEQITHSFNSNSRQRSSNSEINYFYTNRDNQIKSLKSANKETTEPSTEDKNSKIIQDNYTSINRYVTNSEHEKRVLNSNTEKIYGAVKPLFELQSYLIKQKGKESQFETRQTNKIKKSYEEVGGRQHETSLNKKAKLSLNSPAIKLKSNERFQVTPFPNVQKSNEDKIDLWHALYKKFYPVFNLRAEELTSKVEEGVIVFKRLNDSSFNYMEFLENAQDKAFIKKVIEKSFVRAAIRYDSNSKGYMLVGGKQDIWDRFEPKTIESMILADHSMQSLRLKAFDRVAEFEVNIYNQIENTKKIYKMLSTSSFFEFSVFNKSSETSFLIEGLHNLLALVFSANKNKMKNLENEYYAY
jgi:hypothetical protein